jgi:hypothetical protein
MGKGSAPQQAVLFDDLVSQSADDIDRKQAEGGGGGPEEAWGGDTVHLCVPLTDISEKTARSGYHSVLVRPVVAGPDGGLKLCPPVEKPYPGMLKSRVERGDAKQKGEWWGHLIAVRWIKQTAKGHVVEAVSHGPCGNHGLTLDETPAI